MNKIILPDGYILYYAYSMTANEFYCRVGSCNFIFSEENFYKNYRVGDSINSEGHNYIITDIRTNHYNKTIFVGLKFN